MSNRLKSKLVIILLAMTILALHGCGNSSINKISGEIIAGGGGTIHLKGEDGKHYGLVANESTELVWKNKKLYKQLEEEAKAEIEMLSPEFRFEYSEWRFVSAGMNITVEIGEKTGSKMHLSNDLMVDGYVAEKITVTGLNETYINPYTMKEAKPVIYLYPESEMKISVKLDYAGVLTCTYPEYNNGWEVIAAPDGTLTDKNGQIYNYLYWEGISGTEYDFSKGYCVAGEDTAAFLEEALAKLGLNRREANEFIVYWLPIMQENPYNIISFQTDVYTEAAKLEVNPAPDTLIRVFMAWQSADDFVEIPEQELVAPERTGFTVVEWGGAEIK